MATHTRQIEQTGLNTDYINTWINALYTTKPVVETYVEYFHRVYKESPFTATELTEFADPALVSQIDMLCDEFNHLNLQHAERIKVTQHYIRKVQRILLGKDHIQ